MAYTTAALIAAHLGRPDASAGDRVYDEAVQAVNTVDAIIDDWCRRTFEKTPNTAREFRPDPLGHPRELIVGDVVSVSTVEVRGSADGPWQELDASEWSPGQPPGRDLPVREVWRLKAAWPLPPPPTTSARITATWGWAKVPEPVKSAAMLWGCALVNAGGMALVDGSGDVEMFSPGYEFVRAAQRMLRRYQRPAVAG